ncbi:MarR family winged helix-turn-helix transcriptional regulator [Nocardia carnea]|uniref:MarR family winged helix-turn-helix transcriptional regulator n=1 Tax=Nocardia carnea TaxID=37328 RepID=UPI002453EFE6|nr:MarR family transcriptional regulator [Nocardia carnea]
MNSDRRTQGGRDLPTVLRDLAWTVHRLVPEVAGVPHLPTTELAVLKQILATPGITVTELSKRLGMRQSNVSAAVRGLVERGLVARSADPVDRRVIRLTPTEKSFGARQTIHTVWSGTVERAMARLGDEQVAALRSAEDALEALDRVLRESRDSL